jgi:hypothetical protein
MDWQFLFDLAAGVCGFLGGMVLKTVLEFQRDLKEEQKNIVDDVKELSELIHTEFVRRDDFNAAINRIESTCNKILDKLDGKADK